MANRTQKDAHTIKGTNPQYLVEKIIRMRIYDSKFWKEECFGISAELIVDKGMELRYVGGVYGGNVRPTPFICLQLKMLQIQPEKDIIIEFIRQEEFKYIRALGAMYMRLTGTSVEIYKYLEPLYNDYRKLRYMTKEGRFEIIHLDEFVDKLLKEERVCDIQCPRLQKRQVLEESAELEPRVSALEEDLDNLSSSSSDEEERDKSPARKSSPDYGSRRRSSRTPERRRSRSKERDRRRSRSTERKHRSRHSPEAKLRLKSDKDKSSRDRKRTRENSYEREIREANELRAKLGLAPLEQ